MSLNTSRKAVPLRRAIGAAVLAAGLVLSATVPANAIESWYALKINCPSNKHAVIHWTSNPGRATSVWVSRTTSFSSMVDANKYVKATSAAKKHVYDTGMNGWLYWSHGGGSWIGSVKTSSSYATCEAGV